MKEPSSRILSTDNGQKHAKLRETEVENSPVLAGLSKPVTANAATVDQLSSHTRTMNIDLIAILLCPAMRGEFWAWH